MPLCIFLSVFSLNIDLEQKHPNGGCASRELEIRERLELRKYWKSSRIVKIEKIKVPPSQLKLTIPNILETSVFQLFVSITIACSDEVEIASVITARKELVLKNMYR